MTLLPEELSRSDERCGVLELPSYNIGPLVRQQGKIAVRSDPFCEAGVHDCLAGRSDRDRFRHFRLATFCDPCDLGSKACHMVLFLVEGGLGHEHREVDILHAMHFEFGVSELLDLLPDVEGRRA